MVYKPNRNLIIHATCKHKRGMANVEAGERIGGPRARRGEREAGGENPHIR